MQAAGTQPDPDPIMDQYLDPVAATIGEQVRMMRAGFAEHAHHARQRRLRPGPHVQRLHRHPRGIDADHRSSSLSQAAQPAAAATGQLTLTTVEPRRSSIMISGAVTAAGCTVTGTNAVFAGIAFAVVTAGAVIGAGASERSATTTQRRNRLAFRR